MDFQQQIEACTELELFDIIYNLGGYIFYTHHDLADGRYESSPAIEQSLINAQAKAEAAVVQVSRFGIVSLEADGTVTKEYWDWYRKTKKAFEALDDAERHALNKGFKIEV